MKSFTTFVDYFNVLIVIIIAPPRFDPKLTAYKLVDEVQINSMANYYIEFT